MSIFHASELASIKRRAIRRRVWLRVLDRVERGLVNLTIRCVDRVRSSKLMSMLKDIVERLEEALKSGVERLMVEVGWPLARKIANLAVSWGNPDALNWAFDTRLARYLTVAYMNDSEMFKG